MGEFGQGRFLSEVRLRLGPKLRCFTCASFRQASASRWNHLAVHRFLLIPAPINYDISEMLRPDSSSNDATRKSSFASGESRSSENGLVTSVSESCSFGTIGILADVDVECVVSECGSRTPFGTGLTKASHSHVSYACPTSIAASRSRFMFSLANPIKVTCLANCS